MSVLITGNLRNLSNVFCNRMAKNNEIILVGENSECFNGKRIISYGKLVEDSVLEQIMQTYEIETVIYISNSIDGVKKIYNEIDSLENVLYCCKKINIHNIIYVTTNDCFKNDFSKTDDNHLGTRDVVLSACENLCKVAQSDNNFNIMVLKIPYLLASSDGMCESLSWINNAVNNGKIVFPGNKDDITDFVDIEDLANLFDRMSKEPVEGYSCFYVNGYNAISFGEIADLFKININGIQIDYSKYSEAVPVSYEHVIKQAYSDGILNTSIKKAYKNQLREIYGWHPKIDVINSISENFEYYKKEKISNKKEYDKKEKKEHNKKTITIIEVIFGWIIAEMLCLVMKQYTGIGYVDFRVIYVILCGIIYGSDIGVGAASLACVGFIIENEYQTNLGILLYNIGNWGNMAAYFLSGLIPGYFMMKKNDKIDELQKHCNDIEEKHIFLNELYAKSLETKEQLSKQIIGFNDSYGKIYDIVQKLNRSLPDRVMYEATIAVEEFLDCKSVAFYMIDKNLKYARLSAASKELYGSIDHSVRLDSYEKMIEILKDKGCFTNVECLSNYPSFASPIKQGDKLVGMIVINSVPTCNMNNEYANKFKILSGLINDALVRAFDKTRRIKKKSVIPGTKIVKWETFEKILNVKEKMKKDGIADYYVSKIDLDSENITNYTDLIADNIRNEDIIGQGRDGNIYLLLNQADDKDVKCVENRIEAQIVNGYKGVSGI